MTPSPNSPTLSAAETDLLDRMVSEARLAFLVAYVRHHPDNSQIVTDARDRLINAERLAYQLKGTNR